MQSRSFVVLALVLAVVAFACGRDGERPSASDPAGMSSGLAPPPPAGDFDAGATPRTTLQALANKPDDGRYVVDVVVVDVRACHCPPGRHCDCPPDGVKVTNEFADSATWTFVALGLGDVEKRFVVGAKYTLLVLVQNGEPKVIGAGAR